MKYVYGVFIGVLTVFALGWVIHLTIEGKPVAKIKLSEFASEADFAKAISMRLRQELKDHSIVFLGVDPEEASHFQLWSDFLKLQIEPGWKFDEIIVEQGLTHRFPLALNEKIFDFKAKETELKFLWQSEEYKNKRMAVIVPHIYSSQLIKDNPVQRLKMNPNEGRFLSLNAAPFAQKADLPSVNRVPCSAEGADISGQSPLGCAIRKKSMFWSKPLKEGVRLGIVEQVGLHDFMVFYRPVEAAVLKQ